MPTVCCAIGCKHVSGNGACHLKRFPNDEKRANKWAENVRGSNWRRKGWELLCDCHFESSQFEKIREDGARKLRHNAVPTLFPTHTVSLDDGSNLMGTSNTLECEYEPYDLVPLSDVEIQKLPDTVPLIFPEEADFFEQAHFEESAYESHRADGLRKLKQNAVPTVSVSSPIIRSKRKQTVQPRLEFSFDDDCEDSYIAEGSVAPMSVEDEQVPNVITSGCGVDGVDEMSSEMKEIKTVHIMEIVTTPKLKEAVMNQPGVPAVKVTERKGCESRSKEISRRNTIKVLPAAKVKRGRPLKRKRRVKVVEKQCEEVIKNNIAVVAGNKSEYEASTQPVVEPDDTENSVVRCFVCDKVVTPGFYVHLNVSAEASRTVLHQCLEAVLSFECSVSDHEVVCRRCCSLLNYIDRTEAEVAVLKGAVSVCVKERSDKQGIRRKSKLMKSEMLLERFSRGIGEKNYVMELEELFLEKNDEENNSGAIGVWQPVSTVEKLFAEVGGDCTEESEMVGLKSEQNVNGDGPRQIAEVARNENETATNQVDDHEVNELHSIDECAMEKETGKITSDKLCGSVICGSMADEVKNCSVVRSQEKSICSDDDLKHYLRGKQKTHECKICCFKTNYESVMVWHLRAHMKTHQWCDFCCVAIPEKESVLAQLEKMKPIKSKFRKAPPKPKFILPAVPVEATTVSQVPLSSLNVPISLEDVSSESPVVLVDTQSLGNEFVPKLEVEKGAESVKMEDSQDSGVVIVSENVLLSETTKLLPIPSANVVASCLDKSHAGHFCIETSLSPGRQETEALEMYCGILRPSEVDLDKVDDADDVLSECLSNCCDVDGSNGVDDLNGEPCDIPSGECAHPSDGLEDSMETNFLDTLSSQPVTKYPEMLPDICDEAADQNTVSPVCGVTDDNVSNHDVNFCQNNAIGESDLALAYESSVAALMCQSDDSDGILY